MDPSGPESADEFLARARTDAAIHARRRERWLRQRLADEATLGGALAAAVGTTVRLDLLTGDRVSGTLAAVGTGVARLEGAGPPVWVATAAVVAVGVDGPLPAAGPTPDGPGMAEVLAELVDGPDVRLTLVGGAELHGRLVAASVGAGAAVTVQDGAGRVSYASVDAVVRVAAVS